MSNIKINQCPSIQLCPLYFKQPNLCFKEYKECEIFTLIEKYKALGDKLEKFDKVNYNDLEKNISLFESLRERLTNLENKIDRLDKMINANGKLDAITTEIEKKIKDSILIEIDKKIGILVNHICSLNTSIKLENKFDEEISKLMNKMNRIKKCKYCGLPFIWHKTMDGKWFPDHISIENGTCLNSFDPDNDFFDEEDEFFDY